MSRLAKWLIRMYPKAWRGRYGSELAALLEDSNAGWRDNFDVLKGAVSMQSVRWPVIAGGCAALGALAGFAASFLLPQVYVSRATFTVTTPAGITPAEALSGTIRTAVSRRSLTEVIRAQDLYSKDVLNKPLEEVVDTMSRNIHIGAVLPAPDFEISFAYEDRRKAQAATQLLTRSIMDAHLAGSPRSKLELIKPADLPDRPMNPYIFKGSVAGLVVGLLLGSIIARVRRRHAIA
jgi:uncharacterized protein involved in exopolysaccharide biosynthesis